MRRVWRGIWKTDTGMTAEDFEGRLPSNVILIPYVSVMNNPLCFIVKSPSPEEFLEYIHRHSTHFAAVYVVRKSLGGGRYNYINPNYWLGLSVDVG